jgi:hypothetical protein
MRILMVVATIMAIGSTAQAQSFGVQPMAGVLKPIGERSFSDGPAPLAGFGVQYLPTPGIRLGLDWLAADPDSGLLDLTVSHRMVLRDRSRPDRAVRVWLGGGAFSIYSQGGKGLTALTGAGLPISSRMSITIEARALAELSKRSSPRYYGILLGGLSLQF